MLGNLANTLRDRERVTRELRSATAETRVSALLIGALPAIAFVLMSTLNPRYATFFFTDPTGHRLLAVAGRVAGDRRGGDPPAAAAGLLAMVMHNGFILISIGMLAGSAVLLLWSQTRGEQARLDQRLALLRGPAPNEAAVASARLTGLERVLTTGAKDRAELSAALHAAGYAAPSAVAAFALLRLAAVLGFALAVALYGLATGMHHGSILLYAVCAAAVGFLLAKAVLRSRASAGTRRMNKEMPFLLDLLLLLLESGISLDQAFRYLVQQRIGGVERTQRTLAALVDDLQKGMDYELALDRWAARLGVFGARDLAALLKQSLVYGAEIGPSLRDYVREFSDRRLALARVPPGGKRR